MRDENPGNFLCLKCLLEILTFGKTSILTINIRKDRGKAYVLPTIDSKSGNFVNVDIKEKLCHKKHSHGYIDFHNVITAAVFPYRWFHFSWFQLLKVNHGSRILNEQFKK